MSLFCEKCSSLMRKGVCQRCSPESELLALEQSFQAAERIRLTTSRNLGRVGLNARLERMRAETTRELGEPNTNEKSRFLLGDGLRIICLENLDELRADWREFRHPLSAAQTKDFNVMMIWSISDDPGVQSHYVALTYGEASQYIKWYDDERYVDAYIEGRDLPRSMFNRPLAEVLKLARESLRTEMARSE